MNDVCIICENQSDVQIINLDHLFFQESPQRTSVVINKPAQGRWELQEASSGEGKDDGIHFYRHTSLP